MSEDIYMTGSSWKTLKGPFIIIRKIDACVVEIKLLSLQYKDFRSDVREVTKRGHAAVTARGIQDSTKITDITDLIKGILCK